MKKLLLLPFLLGFSVPAFADCQGVVIDGNCVPPEELKKLFDHAKNYYKWRSAKKILYECKDFVMAAEGTPGDVFGMVAFHAVRKKDNLIFNYPYADRDGVSKTAKKYCKNPDLPWAPWKEPTS